MFASGSRSGVGQPEASRQAAAKSGQADSQSLQLPINLERQVGDLDRMLKRHEIRALVVPSRSGFFYDKDTRGFWSKVLPHLTVHSDIVLQKEGELAWAMRKDSSQLKELLDEFLKTRQMGTSFGNTLVRRYLEKLRG